MKKLFTSPLLVIFVFALTISSCKKDGCTDPHASNYRSYAKNDDGSCEYIGCTNPAAENYDQWALEDDNHCDFVRDKFFGVYQVEDACTSDNYSYSLTITALPDFKKVLLNNLGGFESVANVPATIYGNVVTFNDSINGHVFEGGGALNENGTLTIDYTIITNEIQENCHLVGIRQ